MVSGQGGGIISKVLWQMAGCLRGLLRREGAREGEIEIDGGMHNHHLTLPPLSPLLSSSRVLKDPSVSSNRFSSLWHIKMQVVRIHSFIGQTEGLSIFWPGSGQSMSQCGREVRKEEGFFHFNVQREQLHLLQNDLSLTFHYSSPYYLCCCTITYK